MKTEHKVFLDGLRDSGDANMFGAGMFLVWEFGLKKHEAHAVLKEWMDTYSSSDEE